jgi:dihydroorotate dehydrogenase electron transfer subunit
MNERAQRNTIFLEEARILSHEAHHGDQYVLRLAAPECARRARAGQFAHLTVDPLQPMRRPISIMLVDAAAGAVEFLYKVVGAGTALLARRKPGESISCMAPIGKAFSVNARRPLLLGGGLGMPPIIFLANELRRSDRRPLVILGSEIPFPFRARPSSIMVPGAPDGVIGTMPLLEDWNIACRLTTRQGYPGCYDGYVTDLARHWLAALTVEQRAEVAVYACGPQSMLAAVVELARKFRLPVQVSLEEYMACAVGGCAGCAVEVQTPRGLAMQRVCVDGPVFDGYAVFGQSGERQRT